MDEDGKILFKTSKNSEKFIKTVNSKRSSRPSELALAENASALEKFGRGYRVKLGNGINRLIIGCVVSSVAFLTTVFLTLYFFEVHAVFILCVCLLCAIGGVVSSAAIITVKNKDLKFDDAALGAKYRFVNSNVKGSSRRLFAKVCVACAVLIVLGIAVFLPSVLVFDFEPKYGDLTYITGTVESYGRWDSSINIALNENTQYLYFKVPTKNIDKVDDSLFTEVMEGDTITIAVDARYNHSRYVKPVVYPSGNVSLGYYTQKWYAIYIVEANGKEYLSYADCVKVSDYDKNMRVMFACLGGTVLLISSITMLCMYFVCKKREKGEDILVLSKYEAMR